MSYKLVFTPEAEEQLVALYNFIATEVSSNIAAQYTDSVISYCESICTFPIRGIVRDDVRPRLHITNYKKRMIIAFEVDEKAKQVAILGFFYGGQDYEAILQNDSERLT